jgi:hypothetical protein
LRIWIEDGILDILKALAAMFYLIRAKKYNITIPPIRVWMKDVKFIGLRISKR